jgi:integrase
VISPAAMPPKGGHKKEDFKMVAGHLQEKKGYFYIVLSYKDSEDKRQTKWLPTHLPVKGNKKKAEAMLGKAKQQFDEIPSNTEESILFSDFMLNWLEMMKNKVELDTYAAYAYNIKSRIAPYFKEKGILLTELQPKHIQDFYQYEQTEHKVSANTAIHYHANIRKALQYAMKTDLILSNPADKVERPKKVKFIGNFYDSDEMNTLFQSCTGQKIELAILMGAFYGLRRSEIVGLKWDAIDFKKKTITIRFTVTEATIDGKSIIIEKPRTKNESSNRTLPLVPQFDNLLCKLKERQKMNREVFGNSYCKEYLEFAYVDELGERVKPGFITQNFGILLNNNHLRKIRFHDLRHSCASLLLANGVSMKQIQEWLGHSDFSTTANIYAHLDYSSKISSANAMSNCLTFGSLNNSGESQPENQQEAQMINQKRAKSEKSHSSATFQTAPHGAGGGT